VFPSQQYVEHVSDKHKDWQHKVQKGSEKFLDVCINGNTAQTPVSMKEYVRLTEDFVLCEALETKWSNEIRHKCSCPPFLGKLGQRTVLAVPSTLLS
jgi:hypothetical protein